MSVRNSDEIKDKVRYQELREMGMRKERAVRLANAAYEQKKHLKTITDN